MANTQLMLFIILLGIAFGLTVITDFIHNGIANTILAIFALMIVIVAFLSKDYLYLFNSILKRKGDTLVLNSSEAFVFAPSGNAIVRREGENVYASSFIKIPIYKSATDMTKEEKTDLSRLFARILTLSKIPIKLSSQLYVVNKDEYIAKLRNELNQAEEKYRSVQTAGGDSQKAALERSRGEVTMWRNLLDNVSRSQSHSLTLYAMVTALGGTDEEATNIAYQRAEELAGGISAILGVTASVVNGDDILTLIEPDHMIPIGTVSERIRQKTTGNA